MQANIFRIILLIFSLIIYKTSSAQLDTVKLLKTIIEKHTLYNNLSIEYIKNGGIQHPNDWYKKKVYLVKDKKTAAITQMRVETSISDLNKTATIMILNGTQKLFVNPASKRSDLYSFKLLKEDKLDDLYQKLETENLPGFMISEGNTDAMLKEMINYIRNSGNVSIAKLTDTAINGMDCFGIKITDNDKNNGYLANKAINEEEKYADKTIEYTYLRKSDSLIILRKTDFFYSNPYQVRSQIEQVNSYQINNKKNENILLYAINTDTLKSYFQTNTRFNGAENECELADFSLRKLPSFVEKTTSNTSLDLSKLQSKLILLAFWNIDCEDCIMQMNALSLQYDELKASGLEFIAINPSDKLSNTVQTYLSKKSYNFPVVFSEILGYKYLSSEMPAYILLDKDLKIKRIFFQLNQEIVDKLKKELK
ncbi:MAG: TlpA disulfide reductase family protein [Bacteroidetes bacterium]|nr:TlpA disulfide reductase family protein [Bacteroidota bacterium]